MKSGKGKQFLVILAAFLTLGISFKVMVLVEGLTEVRPVNAIPPVAGLLCGPTGALACALGNLLTDLAGTLSPYSVLGVIGNFAAAWLPWRLWYLWPEQRGQQPERPNLHSGKNILRYLVLSCVAAMTVAWILSFGMYVFGGDWMRLIFTYVFWNNLGFSVGLGMPILILLTSPDIAFETHPPPQQYGAVKNMAIRRGICVGYIFIMTVMTIAVLAGNKGPDSEAWMLPGSAAALACLVLYAF